MPWCNDSLPRVGLIGRDRLDLEVDGERTRVQHGGEVLRLLLGEPSADLTAVPFVMGLWTAGAETT